MKNKTCIPCEGGVKPLTSVIIAEKMKVIPDWQLSNCSKFIYRDYEFKGYYKVISFVNAIAWIANREQHHPDLEVGYNKCKVKFTTHAIDGLSENDFIVAAMINSL